MNGRVALDTNIVIALFAADAAVISQLTIVAEVFIPSVVIGELCYGARRSGRVEANLARIERFASASTILACTEETARHYGEIKDALRRQGQPIPENDLWIAALAYQHALTLVTRDAHFANIAGIATERW